MNKIFKILVILLMLAQASYAQQELTSTNKKAIKLYKEGRAYYDSRNNELAELSMLSAIGKDPNFVEAEILLAYIYTESGKFKKAISHYQRSIEINPDYFPGTHASLGLLQLKFGEYELAKKNLEKYLTYTDSPLMMKPMAEEGLINCNFAIEALKNPVPFDPVNLGEGVNSPLPEYYPCLTADGSTLLYTRRLNDKRTYSGYNEDFYVSRKEVSWTKGVNVKRLNSLNNEGAPTLAPNGRFLIFTSCQDPFGNWGKGRTGLGRCDMFYAYKTGNVWSAPKNLGQPVNSKHWEGQPSFSSDGKSLFFVRGIGRNDHRQYDIWTSELSKGGVWSTPSRLSSVINTPGKEESVFIHADGNTLYFSSNGHPGMGGLDIYMSKKDDKGQWTTPVNLGYPINTFNDENSLLVNAEGNLAYFASDRAGGFGGLDLYQFEMPESIRPNLVTYLKGKVYDNATKKALSARFELIDLETGNVITRSYSDEQTGEYLVCLPSNKDYALNVSHKGYLFYSDNFTLTDGTAIEPFEKNVPLNQLKIGESVVLKNVFFETAKFDLKDKSKIELDKLSEFLRDNSSLKIELGGHTDNVGDKKLNLTLSKNRANAVFDYLVRKGIKEDRLTIKGYGDSQPIASNDTEEGRAENRRTEFKIVAK